MRRSRGQANLPALAATLVVLTLAITASLTMADRAFLDAQREADDRRIAASLSDALVDRSSPLTERPNVLNRSAVEDFTAADLETAYPIAGDAAVEVSLNGDRIAATGDATEGTSIRHVVLVAEESTHTFEPAFDNTTGLTVPRRVTDVTVTISTSGDVTVRSVRANQRVLLRNPSGLEGTYDLTLSRLETVRLRFETVGDLSRGDVTLTTSQVETTRAHLEVTVDA